MSGMTIFAYVEDPGAANLMLGLAEGLADHGCTLELWAAATACDHLAAHGITFRDAENHPPQLGTAAADLVAIGTSETPDSPAFSLVSEARQLNLPTVGLVDSPASATARFRGNSSDPLTHLPDQLIVSDQETADAFIELGVLPTQIMLAANPALLRARARGAELTEDSRAALRSRLFNVSIEPVIVFLSELSDGLDPENFRRAPDYTLSGWGGSDARTDIVLETLLDATADLKPRPRIVVRLHPKQGTKVDDAYANKIHSVSHGGSALDVCAAADLVVGMTTTLLSEARQMGQRVLAILPRPAERAWLADLASGAIPCVWQSESIVPAIEHALASERRQPPPPEGCALADALANLANSARPARAASAG